ncbi:kinase-like protein [Daldinia decipiens]|uniref:kinase-like protein n=1 Tax=Daldinia decipiens TaxID=326647 RepID=UPI0020C2B9D9|nr:kinase-like protein [Daldinia decipiens]KAI1659296.1 kinase-like protein [Daldinia decipiens]
MPARFPFIPLLKTETETSKSQPGCQLLVQKPGDRSIWALGASYILKHRPYHSGCEIEIQNAEFARKRLGERQDMPSIPKTELHWRDGDRYFVIERRIEGESLDNALPRLTQQDLARIGHQVGQYLLNFKTITQSRTARLDGRVVNDWRLFKPLPDSSSGDYLICATDSDLASNLALSIARRLDKPNLDAFMAKMPSGLPFTFSHSDVHEGNIMVKDGNFVGLIDWELAGFYPSWWEYINSSPLLSEHFPAQIRNHDALEWFRVYHAIRDQTKEEGALRLSEYLQGRAWSSA